MSAALPMDFSNSTILLCGRAHFRASKIAKPTPRIFLTEYTWEAAAHEEAKNNLASYIVLSTRLCVMENSMSSSKSPRTICLPAHTLEAEISPRAREVLMLLASQTTPENPTIWVCHAAIAEKLRCSPVTIKRSIQKLVEAKLIVETGDLHERRYKFYRVRWSLNTVTPKRDKVVTPAKAVTPAQAGVQNTEGKDWMPACAGMTKLEPISAKAATEYVPPLSSHPGVDHASMLKDSRIAYWAEVARKKHEENLQRYKMFILSLPEAERVEHLNP